MNAYSPTIETLPWPQGNLAVYRWFSTLPSQPKGVLLLVHGLGEHMGRYSETAHFFQQAGWICVGYDHLGHGLSDGERGKIPFPDALVEGLVHVSQHVIAEMPSKIAQELPLILLGHSLGGLVVTKAIATAREQMPDVRATVLSSPALGIHLSGIQTGLLNTLPFVAPNLCLDNGIDVKDLCRDKAVTQAYVDDPLVHRKISIRLAGWMLRTSQRCDQFARDWAIPLLMLLATKDSMVDNRVSERFASLLSPDLVSVHRESTMFHEMLNDPEKERVLIKIADWMDLAVTRLPEAF